MSSLIARPTAGPCWRPCPLNPFAKYKFRTLGCAPTTAFSSSVLVTGHQVVGAQKRPTSCDIGGREMFGAGSVRDLDVLSAPQAVGATVGVGEVQVSKMVKEDARYLEIIVADCSLQMRREVAQIVDTEQSDSDVERITELLTDAAIGM